MGLIVFVIILDNSDELMKGNYGKTQKKTEFNLNNNGYSFYDAMLLVKSSDKVPCFNSYQFYELPQARISLRSCDLV